MEHIWTDQLGNYGQGEVECRNCGTYANFHGTPYNPPCTPDTNPFPPLVELPHIEDLYQALNMTSDDIRRMN